MFEQCTEKTCRVIFFGRYEADVAGKDLIEPDDLVLGLIRGCKTSIHELMTDGPSIEELNSALRDGREPKKNKWGKHSSIRRRKKVFIKNTRISG